MLVAMAIETELADPPALTGDLDGDAHEAGAFLLRGADLVGRAPARPSRSAAEQRDVEAVMAALDDVRERFLRRHTRALYAELTGNGTKAVRAEELVYLAAERVPGLTPRRVVVNNERDRLQKDKDGWEVAQGRLLGHVLAHPETGAHLIEVMLRPTELAQERLEELTRTGRVDLGTAVVERQGRVGVAELRNPRHLNAEDDTTLGPYEAAIDLVLLDPEIEVGVLRGGVVEHPRYAGKRIFGAGLNLTHLYRGQISYLFFPVRDLGLVHKVFRGVTSPDRAPDDTHEKLWIAAAETYAIGGACQLLLTVDHILAEPGCRCTLPARNEGIIPGAANLRLPRFVGDRLARQAILSGRELEPERLADEIVEAEEMDAAIERRAADLSTSGAVSGVANRRALRIGQEPLETFRAYMATYAREQAFCHFSPALIRNLEENWRAHERGD
jgi:(3,5-dihydroxyphenyl)acetyl-CoA 1,2-dioxygenase